MKLDRNINQDGRGKYALVKLRNHAPIRVSLGTGKIVGYHVDKDALDFGNTTDSDFFVIRLKDRFAGPALRAYASAITNFLAGLNSDNPQRAELVEYHHEIIRLAELADVHPNRKTPD